MREILYRVQGDIVDANSPPQRKSYLVTFSNDIMFICGMSFFFSPSFDPGLFKTHIY